MSFRVGAKAVIGAGTLYLVIQDGFWKSDQQSKTFQVLNKSLTPKIERLNEQIASKENILKWWNSGIQGCFQTISSTLERLQRKDAKNPKS
ncbi:uncharacterized protein LOC106173248 isoform X2 [Lingula anatina]|uniref:Uncharacterized protein LOC106173248 isoform X2 n=1 Tax=Lingula anatina TaxID=7574 RepID=A0A1S3JH82_LINAN|nr:uncharacterized protein LOC106173248 isoform X2 [Lingula anatina]|eukprot:XP_013409757.1 uncharacterized protein LOC106173248 isoform X2 [Lingula anatina]